MTQRVGAQLSMPGLVTGRAVSAHLWCQAGSSISFLSQVRDARSFRDTTEQYGQST